MIARICICGRGGSGHEPEVRGHVYSGSALSVALGLPGVLTRGGGIEEGGGGVCVCGRALVGGVVSKEGAAEVGLRISRHMMRVGRRGRAWESERRWK